MFLSAEQGVLGSINSACEWKFSGAPGKHIGSPELRSLTLKYIKLEDGKQLNQRESLLHKYETWVQISSIHVKSQVWLGRVPVSPELWRAEAGGSLCLLITSLPPGSVKNPYHMHKTYKIKIKKNIAL